ncbi:MAG: hypothetical protein ABSD98_11125 [Candidatus Korobacteraceae bacterium]|jgi:hypothetical protein
MTSQVIHDLLASYPRTRPSLSQRHQELYVAEYKRGRSGGGGLPGTVAKVEAWMHKEVASAEEGARILELGAGTLNHLRYENRPAAYDVVEPFRELWEGNPQLKNVSHIYKDISEVPDQKYDRIISVAVLEHLTDLPYVVARCGLMLAVKGRFAAGIPSEGGFLWSLGWRATTGLSFRLRTGLSYEPYMRHEHVNLADEIITVTRYFFEDVRIRRFPLENKHLSLYTALDASRPRLNLCREFIQHRKQLVT